MLEVIKTTNLATLTRRDMAKVLNVSYSTIERWEHDKVNPIPHTRKGQVVRFNKTEVINWWNAQKVNKFG